MFKSIAVAAILAASLSACGSPSDPIADVRAAANTYVTDCANGDWTAMAKMTTGPGAPMLAATLVTYGSVVQAACAAENVLDDTISVDGDTAVVTDPGNDSKPVGMVKVDGTWKVYVASTN